MGFTFWAKQGWITNRFDHFVKFLGQSPQPTECIDLNDFRCDFYLNAGAVLSRMVKTNADDRYRSIEEVITALAAEPSKKTIPPIPEVKENPGISFNYPLLTVESGTNRNARTLVGLEPGESIVLGRADIAGNDLSISSKHLIFTRQHGRYFVNDFHSKNGTLLRGMLLNPNALPLEVQNDDRIKVGDIFLRFNSPT
jgi:serine/threonine-protein kinase